MLQDTLYAFFIPKKLQFLTYNNFLHKRYKFETSFAGIIIEKRTKQNLSEDLNFRVKKVNKNAVNTLLDFIEIVLKYCLSLLHLIKTCPQNANYTKTIYNPQKFPMKDPKQETFHQQI